MSDSYNEFDELFNVAESPLSAAHVRQDVRRILREETLRALTLFNREASSKTKPTGRKQSRKKGN